MVLQNKANCETAARCRRCGMCCRKGGPALHKVDRDIFLSGQIGYNHLLTIRKGELAYSPVSEQLEPVSEEFIKIAGRGRDWICCLYDEEKTACKIYENRPLECRLLECWNPDALLSVVGKDTLNRFDVIPGNDPRIRFVERHERECPSFRAEELFVKLKSGNNSTRELEELTGLFRKDLEIRAQAGLKFELSLAVELFLFGRPLFKLPSARGLTVHEAGGEILVTRNPEQ